MVNGSWLLPGIDHQPSAISHDQRSRIVARSDRRQRITPRDPGQRFEPAASDTVPHDHRFGVAAARWREAAAQPDVRGRRGERALVEMNRPDRQRLRVPDEQGCQQAGGGEGERSRNGSRSR
jgi:hypothetical protein